MRKTITLSSAALALVVTLATVVAGAPARAAGTDIGIVPTERYCPVGLTAVAIHMDDEDHNNANTQGGFVGATGNTRDTDFFLCRVSGDGFRALRAPDGAIKPYAVLKLGSVCPNGSQQFARSFDNEDDDNENWYEGDIYPNVSDRNTKLYFCLFGPGSASSMATYPDVGFSYGVFAGYQDDGYVFIDDEDSDNANGYEAPAGISSIAQSIVSAGRNTTIRFVRAR